MSQLRYRVIGALAKRPNHIRGIAKELGTNPTSIARTMKILETLNIVDFKKDGKNKTYALKTSFEAFQYRHIVEHINLIEAVTNHPVLRLIVERILQEDRIKMSLLFGSYARGTPTLTSDIDIYLETDDKEMKKRIESLHSNVNVKIGSFNKENLLIKEIIKNHIIIKGVERYHELIHQNAS